MALNPIQKGSVPSFIEGDVLPEGASQELWGPHRCMPLLTHRFITACSFSRSSLSHFLPQKLSRGDSQSELPVALSKLNLSHNLLSPHSIPLTIPHCRREKSFLLVRLCGLQAPCQKLHFPACSLPDGVMWSPPNN